MTAYEMRISDWSSDVCSSDLLDVRAADVHAGSIAALADLGIVRGTGGGLFRPEAPVTRAQTMTFLVGAYELATGAQLPEPATAPFGDIAGSGHDVALGQAAPLGVDRKRTRLNSSH